MKSPRIYKRPLLLLGALITVLFPLSGNGRSMCVQIINDLGNEQSVPVNLAGALQLNFRHSIYGSQVEEIFRVRPGGFELTQLRYGEARLAEFYGHEFASHDHDAWVVTPAPVFLASLDLISTSDRGMSVQFDPSTNVKQLRIPPSGALRLTVGACDRSAHG